MLLVGAQVDLFADHTDFLVVAMVVRGVWGFCHRNDKCCSVTEHPRVCSGSVSAGQFCQQVSP